MSANQLIHEKSPYLLQHAHNPVDWYAWGPEAFEKARTDDKPIFLSIGYSTCHWCHVMERESFESEEIASVLNQYFVPIKVDREERPDVDRVYMTFVQATTGGGGWPMSVWLTPDLKPFYGGTYFPPDSRWGRPGFRQVLEQLASAWQSDRSRIIESGTDVLNQLKTQVHFVPSEAPDATVLDSGFFQFRRSFDSKLGGFGGAPKFPRVSGYNFLLRYAYRTETDEAAEMVLVTLREMAKGGINDHLGGGFHRYSVDSRWFVPHFEKMLYDQAQIAVSYLEGYQVSGDEQFAAVARDILDYVLRDMTDERGGFYSAEDADSVIEASNPHEKGEGAFYVWSRAEIDEVLGQPQAEWFAYRFGVEPEGNVLEDPHDEFRGKNILYQRRTVEETAAKFGTTVDEMRSSLEHSSRKLLDARGKRIRPHLDDKVLTAWNGLMISAFAKGSQVLDDERYLLAAKRAAEFILSNMYREGLLLRRWREGSAAIPAFLDDYAFFVAGLIDLYQAGFDSHYVEVADELTGKMLDLFEDVEHGGFFSTAEDHPDLVMRMKEDYDGAEPSGSSIATHNLLRLAHISGNERYRTAGERALRAFSSRMTSQPTALPQMLVSLLYQLDTPKQVVLAGDRSLLRPFENALHRRFLPHHLLLWSGTKLNNYLENMPAIDGKPTAYVCENFACQLPVNDVEKFSELLK